MFRHLNLILLCQVFSIIFCLLFYNVAEAKEREVARTVLAFYDGLVEEKPKRTRIHRYAEMPLNHLGIVLEYRDINAPLPDLSTRDDVRGVITWFERSFSEELIDNYVEWGAKQIKSGKQFVIINNMGFIPESVLLPQRLVKINNFLSLLGLHYQDEWQAVTFNVDFAVKDKMMVGFERDYEVVKPAYSIIKPRNSGETVHLLARKKGLSKTDSALVATHPRGGYIAQGYAVFEKYDSMKKRDHRYWYVNPFSFFKRAFNTALLPKADTTTLMGKRIYYSHIDGDGWINMTTIKRYAKERRLSAYVVMEEAIKPYPDLPVSIAPIAGDLDRGWVGSFESQDIARALLKLPQVELATHTYSHPFQWSFFKDYDKSSENRFFGKSRIAHHAKRRDPYVDAGVASHYATPRAYAHEPFELKKEISGSVETIESFAPEGKRVKIVMWSGNTEPFEEAVSYSRTQGLFNINGGDSRFDSMFPSYAWVPPVGVSVGRERQIYASNSNENTYTNLWTGPFHGFRYLKETVDNTERPRRIKPFNVYYHMYSGDHEASIKALTENLDYARVQDIIPVEASHYAAIGNGFYSTKIQIAGKQRWRVSNRGRLQTIRFDNANNKHVYYPDSKGVIGYTHYQDNLYVFLDEKISDAYIALNKKRRSPLFDLETSRWTIFNVKRGHNNIRFKARGYGDGNMIWRVAKSGTYQVVTRTNKIAGTLEQKMHVGKDRKLQLSIPSNGADTVSVVIKKVGGDT